MWLALLTGVFAMPVHATIIFQENFSYPVGGLNGNNGGTGFTAAWTAAATATIAAGNIGQASPVLNISGNNVAQATRAFGTYNGDNIYVGFFIRWQTGAIATNDTLLLFLDNGAAPSASFGITGSTTTDFIGRTQLPGAGQTASSGVAAESTNYFIVIRLSKSTSGVGNPYNTISLWVNPTIGSLGSPDATSLVDVTAGLATSLSRLGIYTSGLNVSGGGIDHVWVDGILAGDAWTDFFVPEPSTWALTAAGLLYCLRRFRKR